MSVLDLVRPDLRDFAGYASARRTSARGSVWLNANESPLPSAADPSRRLHRYPEPQPPLLRERLAAYYGVEPGSLAITRGSDEGIDLLVRALCRPGIDAVGLSSPGFGMYAVSAALQGAPVVDVPLREAMEGFAWDFDGLRKAVLERGVRLLFLCSPANPTGQALPAAELLALLEALRGRAVVVVDEAYAEFSRQASAIELLARFPELVVLRTLSKAHALAGARIGALVAAPALVALLRNLSALTQAAARTALAHTEELLATVEAVKAQRDRIVTRLGRLGLTVVPTEANFLLFGPFDQPASTWQALLDKGILVRDLSSGPGLAGWLRVNAGTDDETSAFLAAIEEIL